MVRDRLCSYVTTRALLDTGATNNFISENFIKCLGVEVNPDEKFISTIDGMSTISRGSVRITIKSLHNDYKLDLTCLILPRITGPVPSINFPRELVKIPANIKLADPNFHISRPVDLLIGSIKTLSLLSIGQINLMKNGYNLRLQKTQIGWVIAGGMLESTESEKEVSTVRQLSKEENDCELHFKNIFTRDDTGRYVVRLPFRCNINPFIGSRDIALKRLFYLEKRLSKNAELKESYSRIINIYLELGHMSIVNNETKAGYYMPHHAIFKESSFTTKDNLVSHLMRFHMYRYVITADIEKMYRQIWVHKQDRQFQRILWRRNNTIQTYELNTLTFGVSSSPFLATRVIKQLAVDERKTFLQAAEILENHRYVDDLLTGATTIEKARVLRDEIISLLARGGFAIRQGSSKLRVKVDNNLKTLGVTWNACDDKIYYTPNYIRTDEKMTKRKILWDIAKIYDPLGLLRPVVLYLKRIMQNVWRAGLDWDESLPQDLYTEWSVFTTQWEAMGPITFARNLIIKDNKEMQLHGFCDASSVGYGACIYIRSKDKFGMISSQLVTAKSRVAPIKPLTIPRLELCGASLLAHLFDEVIKIIDIKQFSKVIFWCDSSIVLYWLDTSPHKLKTYVANRVTNIKLLSGEHEWRHINSIENPADAISRGQLPFDFVKNILWRHGPNWLIDSESHWPARKFSCEKVPEMKEIACISVVRDELDIYNKFSSYLKTVNVIAYCLRFRKNNEFKNSLGFNEIDQAERHVIRYLQNLSFPDIIRSLNNSINITQRRFANLSPFLHQQGLIRVGGRLHKSNLSFAKKHPILLPNHRLVDCLIRETHQRHFHSGIQSTLYNIRQKYWLLNGKQYVRKVIRSCMQCFRFETSTITCKMGDLPSCRVSKSFPFSHTGVDFCGPFFIKEKKFRNQKRIKIYVAVFVCMSIKAVHLDVVSDLTADGFLAVLRRFTSRRGIPNHLYSDNGSNFVGVKNQLREVFDMFHSDSDKDKFNMFAQNNKIQWHFIPPAAPHFGGLWESSVKIFKHHLYRVIGDSLFTYEEFHTLTTEIEGVINSRPITSLSSDPNDLEALSPGHFLAGRPITFIPQENLEAIPENRLSKWQHIYKVRQDFWKRWSLEYLNELQIKSKWWKEGINIKIGELVLIKNKILPCSQWMLGRVTKIHPGHDGVVRAVTMLTSSGELQRANRINTYSCICLYEWFKRDTYYNVIYLTNTHGQEDE
ncbi:uncharacterized protein [Prorops nasuta]|uniref:uncharacterized protein n=1 Tax=Prorops nasuta TaxID=863751 RepID=UPI0034CDCD00